MKLYKSDAGSWIAGEFDFILTAGEVSCEFIDDYVKLTEKGTNKIIYFGPISGVERKDAELWVPIVDREDFELWYSDFFNNPLSNIESDIEGIKETLGDIESILGGI